MSDRKYAMGEREPAICKHCGSPYLIIYHGPRANHTVEPILLALSGGSPLSDEEKRVYEKARKSVVEARR